MLSTRLVPALALAALPALGGHAHAGDLRLDVGLSVGRGALRVAVGGDSCEAPAIVASAPGYGAYGGGHGKSEYGGYGKGAYGGGYGEVAYGGGLAHAAGCAVASCSKAWVPGGYTVRIERVWVAGASRKVWRDPVYVTRYDACGRPFPVLVRPGRWEVVHEPGRWGTKRVRVWEPGRWTVACAR